MLGAKFGDDPLVELQGIHIISEKCMLVSYYDDDILSNLIRMFTRIRSCATSTQYTLLHEHSLHSVILRG